MPAPKNALGEGVYKAKNIIIATGARPRVLPGIEPDGDRIWTYFEAMVPKEMPKSLLVMGSGAIGMEFASFYRSMGAEVTVIELLPQILPVEDAEIAAHARKRFEKRGIKVLTDAKVTKVEKIEDRRHGDRREQGRRRQQLTGRPADLGRRHRRQQREPRAREARREGRPRDHHRRRSLPDQRAGHLGDRRCRRRADAGAQGRARGGDRGRDHRGAQGPRPRQAQGPGLHLLRAAGRERRADRGQGQGEPAARSRSAASRSSATARRSRSASPRGWSRRSSTPRPASCWARTWSAPR